MIHIGQIISETRVGDGERVCERVWIFNLFPEFETFVSGANNAAVFFPSHCCSHMNLVSC